MKKIAIIGTLLLVSLSLFSQQNTVKWYNFEEAIELNKTNPKKILIDVYTDWCGYCKIMDNRTFKNKDIARYINENFYAVKLNAESREPIEFAGRTYKWIAQGNKGYHELAAVLLNGKMSYPSIVYMNEKNQFITTVPGYRKPKEIEPILNFIAEDHFMKTKWEEYIKTFKSTIK